MKRTSLRGLYAITPEGLDTSVLTVRAETALKGGARILQYRDKTKPVSLQVTEARKLCALCHRLGALLIVNDSLPLALAVNADGVHLGGDDGDLADARRQLGPDKVLGASCYADFDRAKAAAAAGADYVAFGAVFVSPTKPHAARADLSLFDRCRRELHLPSCAIGGITLENATSVVTAGADMLAVISDLFNAQDIETRARAYLPLFEGDPT